MRFARAGGPAAGSGRAAGRLSFVFLGAVLLFQVWLLLPETILHPTPLNDDALHIAASLEARDRLGAGSLSAIDPWFPYWSLGYPLWHAYQPLPHLATGALSHLAAPGSFLAFFHVVKLLLLLAYPFCVYGGARWIGLDRAASAAAALLAPLVSTDALYGLEYGSYLWRGSGLFTQLWAMDLLPLALGRGIAALRGRAGALGAAGLVAATLLAHEIYGLVAAAGILMAAFVLRGAAPAGLLAWRVAAIGALSALLVAFFVVPMLWDAEAINHSRWESSWKWDSYGHVWVITKLLTGEIFDHGRLPLLTALVLGGAALSLRRRAGFAERIAGAGFLSATAIYFGRPTWGLLLDLALVPRDLHLHRLIGAVHLFGVLCAGLALARLVERARRSRRPAAVVIGAGVLLAVVAMAWERHAFVRQGDAWAAGSERAIETERADLSALRADLEAQALESPGRVYPGLAGGWGKDLKAGSVPLYAFLSSWRIDALAFLFHSMSLPSDVMVLFDESRASEYDVFDVRYAVMDRSRAAPSFLRPARAFGRYQIYEAPSGAPSSGHVALGRLAFATGRAAGDRYAISSAWLKSDLPALGQYGLLPLRDAPAGELPIWKAGEAPPEAGLDPAPEGRVLSSRREPDAWSAEYEMDAPGIVVLKESYHPGWRAEIDGQPAGTFAVTPGFLAAQSPAGRHRVTFRYRAGALKTILLVCGPVALGLLGVFLRVRRRARAMDRPVPPGIDLAPERAPAARRAIRALLAVLFLVSILPLLQGKLVSGHDALEYPPRLVEFHENLRHGWLAPLWAPDLANGHGQPLFLFSPPLYYAIAEVFRAAGAGLAQAASLAAIVLMGVAAWGAWCAGKEAWGRAGAWIVSAAYTVSPYLLTDLYVRANFNDLAAAALFPWAALGVLRLWRSGGRSGTGIVAIATALVALSHVGSLLILAIWVGGASAGLAALARQPRIAVRAAGGLLLGAGLAAFFLVPCIAHMSDVKTDLLRTDFLSYTQHFVEPIQLLRSDWGYGLSVAGPGDGMSFGVGLLHLGLALVAMALLVREPASHRREANQDAAGPRVSALLLGLSLVFAVLTTAASAAVWRSFVPLQYLAYPWRLLSVVSMGLSLAAGGLAASRRLQRAGLRKAAVAVVLASLIVWAAPRALAQGYASFSDSDYDPARIAALGITTTTREEYDPRWVTRRPPASGKIVEVLEGTAFVLAREGDPWDRRLRVRAQSPSRLALRILYFPGWRVSVDDQDVKPGVHPEDGRILVEIPEGAHEIRVRLGRTPWGYAGLSISLVSLGVFGLLGFRPVRKASHRRAAAL